MGELEVLRASLILNVEKQMDRAIKEGYAAGYSAAREAARKGLPSIEDIARIICISTECQAGICKIEGQCMDHNYGPRLRGNKPLARRFLKATDQAIASLSPPKDTP